ncbi:EEF1A lysine methyltransferase 1-like [Gordionus sp. m RMFG-2023]|uniref:EEF1A lysine methyltransferase 1-like n=1 Tax=Gordionus sp. m RMFG-2023 TaxID=3053472 RepID=UPI0031FD4482
MIKFEKDDINDDLSDKAIEALNTVLFKKLSIEIEDSSHLHFPTENWQLSQFWYNETSSSILANEIIKNTVWGNKIGIISAPSVYNSLLKKIKIFNLYRICYLFEYDKRFSYFPNYIFYDYKEPLKISKEFKDTFDFILVDPPFLSEECLSNISQTLAYLTSQKIILCTGEIMQHLAFIYASVLPTNFCPEHENNLANKFLCYSNYNAKIKL